MQQAHPLLFGGNVTNNERLDTVAQKNVLGALCFTASHDAYQPIKAQLTAPCLQVPMQNLLGDEASYECWFGVGALEQGVVGDIQYQYDGDVLFGVIHLPEKAFKPGSQTPLQQATASAYRQIFALVEQLNFPHIFRFWNYIADINQDSFGLERYRQFNQGRYDAFLAFNREVEGNVPAACALGYTEAEEESTTLCIAFLAGRVQPVAIENPRQVSAYQYPEKYGPVSPTFSRGALVKLQQSELLLISGTASIVGHATQHTADAVVQAHEAMKNIEAVLAQANAKSTEATFSLADLHYRAYVRHPSHANDIHEALIQHVGPVPKVTYLQADICRRDLLLEIEATAEHACALSSVIKG